MDKNIEYQNLVSQRKQCFLCKEMGFINQSYSEHKHWDTDEIGNMSTWANNLDAEVIIVAQDYADVETYKRDEGKIQGKKDIKEGEAKDYATKTNYYLRELTKILGLDIGLPTMTSKEKIFITNSVLCLKTGKMNAPIHPNAYKSCGKTFLKPLVELIIPRIIITLGATPTKAVISAYKEQILNGEEILNKSFAGIFNEHNPIKILNGKFVLFPVYHPGLLGRINRQKIDQDKRNGWELQQEDWERIKKHMDNN